MKNLKNIAIKYLLLLTGIFTCFFDASSQTVIDVHSHIILSEYMAVLEKHDALMEETFPLPKWNANAQVEFMKEANIEYSVLTMPAPLPFYGDVEESKAIIRHINEASAKIKKEYPGKFKFCASLPLPDINAAIEEAIYALDTLHADGIRLATNSRGLYIGDEKLDTLMSVLNERSAVIIIHPHRPTPYSEEITKTTPLPMYEYPAETTRAVINMISRNVLVRYPNIKVVVPHCGSFLPLAIPRMKSILPVMITKGYMKPIDWEGNLSKIYYDLAGNPTPEIINMMLTITSPEHIMFGSDYPYLPNMVILSKLNKLKELLKNDTELKDLSNMFLYENAQCLFDSKYQSKKEY